ncbi:MAG: quinone-dependent dihydroorotate dehydrogenase [Bacteroidales bacterium]|nr:quinone-dependent dihydroorotate dehydrogenase [Bacteroidales bacterium]
MLYKLLTYPQLLVLNPEKVLQRRLGLLKFIHSLPLGRMALKARYCALPSKYLHTDVCDLYFPNPVGLAAGVDTDGKYARELGSLGFGFVEIGSRTPEPQDRPKKGRQMVFLPKDNAFLSNGNLRNKGVIHAINQLSKRTPGVILAGNISKNPTSSKEEAIADFDKAFSLIYDFVDMIVVNVSCPNSKSVNDLQDITYLSEIINSLISLRHLYDDYKPIAVKLSTDIPKSQLDYILDFMLLRGVDAVVATNAVNRKDSLKTSQSKMRKYSDWAISGAPLLDKMLYMVSYIKERTNGCLPIIATGGIDTPQKAVMALEAGASLVQMCSAVAIQGPGIVRRTLRAVRKYRKSL